MSEVSFGAEVTNGMPGSGPEKLLVIGVMHYSSDKNEVVMVASDETVGMPINYTWLIPTGRTDKMAATELRQRYSDRFGAHWFKGH